MDCSNSFSIVIPDFARSITTVCSVSVGLATNVSSTVLIVPCGFSLNQNVPNPLSVPTTSNLSSSNDVDSPVYEITVNTGNHLLHLGQQDQFLQDTDILLPLQDYIL